MKVSSPSVGRIVSILNFLADHPRERFTLTDIVRALKISRATCHVLLSGMVEAGILYRTVDKTYLLGGTLARIGQIAANSLSELQVAGPEMRALADKFDAICSAIYREGYQAIVKERAISGSHIGWPMPVPETKIPLDPPHASSFFVWENDDVVEKWFDRYKLSKQQRQELKRRMTITRQRGFVFGIRKVKKFDEDIAKSLLLRLEQSDYIMDDLDPKRDYNLAMVAAPVLEPGGKVALILTLNAFTHTVSGKFIQEVGTALRSACDRIAQFGRRG